MSQELGECLNTISQASPEIAQDSQYKTVNISTWSNMPDKTWCNEVNCE